MKSSEVQGSGFLPVKVLVPLPEYKRLYAEATAARITVAQLILRKSRRPQLPAGQVRPPRRRGGPSKYTPRVGAEIAEARAMSMSWSEVSLRFELDPATARKYLTRYENEERESAESGTAA